MIAPTVSKFHSRRVLLIAVLLVLALQAVLGLVRWDRIAQDGLYGPDAFMRILRVVDLHEKGNWYDPHFTRTNAPNGETLHWGRPLDGLLYALAWPISKFTDFKTAALWAGIIVGPLLMLLSIPVWSWGTVPFLRAGPFLMIFVMTSLTGQLRGNFEPARPDHHGFLAVLFILQLAAALRIAAGAGNRWTGFVMGAAGGIAIWASVEALLAQAVFALALAYFLLRRTDGALGHIVSYAAGLAAALSVAMVLERTPGAYLAIEFKRFSIVHWTLAAVTFAVWWGLWRRWRDRADGMRMSPRVAVLAAGGAIPLAAMAALFPDFFRGPLVEYDPAVMGPWLETIREFRPMWPDTADGAALLATHFGAGAIGLCFIVYDLVRGDPRRRRLNAVLLIGMAIYVPISLATVRWVIYVQVLALIPWVLATAQAFAWTGRLRVGGRSVPLRTLPTVALITGPLLVAAVAMAIPREAGPAPRGCDWRGMAAYLTTLHARESGDPILLTYLFRGPELVWNAPYRVVGAPYGNNDSIRDTNTVFKAASDDVARAPIDRRGVGLILICPNDEESGRYRDGLSGSFYSRLEAGRLPAWLRPMPLPEGLADGFRLFRVVGR